MAADTIINFYLDHAVVIERAREKAFDREMKEKEENQKVEPEKQELSVQQPSRLAIATNNTLSNLKSMIVPPW